MEGVLPDGTQAVAQISREIHIIDDLKAGMLIGADILTPERMIIDFATQSVKIGTCHDITVPISSQKWRNWKTRLRKPWERSSVRH